MSPFLCCNTVSRRCSHHRALALRSRNHKPLPLRRYQCTRARNLSRWGSPSTGRVHLPCCCRRSWTWGCRLGSNNFFGYSLSRGRRDRVDRACLRHTLHQRRRRLGFCMFWLLDRRHSPSHRRYNLCLLCRSLGRGLSLRSFRCDTPRGWLDRQNNHCPRCMTLGRGPDRHKNRSCIFGGLCYIERNPDR